jgi:hypothetical protein
MGNGRIDFVHNTCLYCSSSFQKAKSRSPLFASTAPTCPKCGLVQPHRSHVVSPQEEQKLLSDRIEILNQRLVSLQSLSFGLDRQRSSLASTERNQSRLSASASDACSPSAD